MLSVRFAEELLFPTGPDDLILSPLRIVLLASAAVYGLSFWQYRQWLFAYAAATAMILAAAGHSLASIREMAFHKITLLVPRSAAEASVMMIVAAFVFLALGAAVSFSRKNGPARPLVAKPRLSGAPGSR